MNVERIRIWLWGTAAAIAVAGIALMLLAGRPLRRPVPDPVGQVSDFALKDQSARKVKRVDLLGAPWVADFIFTRCQGPCPLMTQKMAALERGVPAEAPAAFVTFSVDPGYDTPKVLAAYMKDRNITAARWHFLTGPRKEIVKLVMNSFALPIGQILHVGAEVQLAHSERFVLVDAKGFIRGYYDSQSSKEMALLRDDLDSLIAESR